MITKSYSLQFDMLLDYHIRNESPNIEEVNRINNILYGITSRGVKLVQTEVETATETSSVEQVDQGKKRFIKTERAITEPDAIINTWVSYI